MIDETGPVNGLARILMAAWEHAEGKPVTPSYVATFADLARAVLVAGGPEMSIPPDAYPSLARAIHEAGVWVPRVIPPGEVQP